MLEEAMQRFAGKPAFRCFGRRSPTPTPIVCRATSPRICSKARGEKGERIAVMLPNIPAFPIAMIGILRAGAAQVNVNPLYTPRELEHQLNDAGVETIVIFAGATPTLAEIVAEDRVKTVITVAPATPRRRRFRATPWTRGSRSDRLLRCARRRREPRIHARAARG
jgi:long-chain acyl-CoA synthetase